MNKLEKRTIILNTIFSFGSALVSNFVSIYLFIYTKSIPMMCLYIIIRIGMFPIFFIVGSKLVKKHPFTLTYTIGLTLITLALVYALTGGPLFEANPYYVLIAAAIIGCGEGFYYLSANTCNQIVSTVETRSKFFAFNGMFTNMTSLLSPIYASFILSLNADEMLGYRRMLVTIIAIFIIVIGVALSMNKRSEDQDSHISKVMITKDKQWQDHNKAVFFYGLRNSLELNTISLLLYKAAGSGGVYSKLNILFTFITIGSYRVINKFLTKDKIDRTFKIGVAIKTISTYILVFVPSLTGAIIFGVSNAFATVLYDNSYNYLSATVIGRYPKEMTARVVVRETYLSASRCLSMLFIIACYKLLPESIYLQVSVPILALATIPVERILLKYKPQ